MAVRDAGQGARPRRGAARSHRASRLPSSSSTTGDEPLATHLAAAGFAADEPRIRLLARAVARELLNLPRHLGQHSGGMVIAAGPPRRGRAARAGHRCPGRVVVQWDKDDCADLGHHQGRPARPRHDGGAGGGGAADPRARGRRRSTRAPAAGRSEGLRACCSAADTVGVFQVEIARADGDAAAHEARRTSTTWSSRWRSSARARSSGKMVQPVPRAARTAASR